MIGISSRPGLNPSFSSAVNVKAYNDEQAKQKAIGRVIEANPIFKRRNKTQYWNFTVTNISKGAPDGN